MKKLHKIDLWGFFFYFVSFLYFLFKEKIKKLYKKVA